MNSTERRIDDLVVVDANFDDYAPLLADERMHALPRRHYATGEEALRGFDPTSATLWLVNFRLPDMTGVGFLELVRRRVRRSPVFLVSDVYSPEDELAARAAGASAFLCKPVDAAWLRLCRSVVARSASRKGAPHSLG
jgi:DNA-binding response OmpR family regulator